MSVIANPTLTGNELDLSRLQVGDRHYRAPFTRKNLLDNWYFVGGGDQQGAGIFPINQKKQTNYSTLNGVTIDCWKLRNEDGNLAIGSAGITKSRTDATKFGGVVQGIENGVSSLAGKTVTFSVLISAISVDKSWIAISNGNQVQYVGTLIAAKACESVGLHTLTTVIPDNLTNRNLNFWITAGNITASALPAGTGSVTIAAAKVEIGDTQTLAHLENGVWVLNELPDYTTQLLRCQRFFRVFTSTSASDTGYGYSTNPKNLRPEMRATPSTGSFTYGGTTYYYLDANL